MRIHRDALVALERALRFLETVRVLQAERYRLVRLPAEHGHELLVLAPDLRLEGGATSTEVTNDVPVAAGEVHRLADLRVGEPPNELRAHAYFCAARDGKMP